MTNRKVILYSFFVYILFVLFIVSTKVFFSNSTFDAETIIFGLLFLLAPWIIGIFIGITLSAFASKPKAEPYFYLAGQIAIILCVTSFIVYNLVKDFNHERNFANMEHNHDLLNIDRDFSGDNIHPNTKAGFLVLEETFKNPNEFRLYRFFTRKRDTLIGGESLVVRSIYFSYRVKKDSLFTRVDVVNDLATIIRLNQRTSSDREYLEMSAASLKELRETLLSIKHSIDSLPDSTRKMINDTIRKAFE